jgi:hypothetical protein
MGNRIQPESSTLCAICQCPIIPGDAAMGCPACHAAYHTECWVENKGCAVYGCPQVPPTERREAVEIPASYWGQEHKNCPKCGAEILAAAVRCRNCGAIFESATPLGASEFGRRQDIERRAPELRRTVVILAILCSVPAVAAFASGFGYLWYRSHREEVKSLPSIYPGLCRLALGVGAGQTLIMIAMAFSYAILRAS